MIKSLKFLAIIATIVTLAGCTFSTSDDQNVDVPIPDGAPVASPWDSPDDGDIQTDPSDGTDTTDDIEPGSPSSNKTYDPLYFTPAEPNLDKGRIGADYDKVKIRAKGGSGDFLMTVSGTIPPGLDAKCGSKICDGPMEVSSVSISGTPTASGFFEFSVKVEDLEDDGTSLEQTFKIAIDKNILIDTSNSLKITPAPVFSRKLSVAATDEIDNLQLFLSNISSDEENAGTLQSPKNIQLRIYGGQGEYSWDAPVIWGDATITPDVKDSSKAILKITKAFPTVNGLNMSAYVPIKVKIKDANGEHAETTVELEAKHPTPILKDMEVVGCNGYGECGNAIINATFYNEDSDMVAQWANYSIGDDPNSWNGPYSLNFNTGHSPSTRLHNVERIRIDGCVGALDPEIEDDTLIPCFVMTLFDYAYIKLRTKYWEGKYDRHLYQAWTEDEDGDSSITIIITSNIVQDMEGYDAKEGVDSVWRKRFDNLPRPPVEEVVDGPVGQTTNDTSPTPAEGDTCFLSDEMRNEGYICVPDEVGLTDEGCPMTQAEIDSGARCLEGCVFSADECASIQNLEQFIAEDKSTGKATLCVGL